MKVTVRQKSSVSAEESVVTWARNADEVDALIAVAQLLQHAQDDSPWAPLITSINIEF